MQTQKDVFYTKTQCEIELGLVHQAIEYLIIHNNYELALKNAIDYFDIVKVEGSQFMDKDDEEREEAVQKKFHISQQNMHKYVIFILF